LPRVVRKPTNSQLSKRPDRHVGSLKKDEVERLDELKTKALAARSNERPDVDSTIELMYLRILGRVKNRGPVEAELKQLKGALDKAASLMNKIMDEAEKQGTSK
jgi:hypothetical protein